MRVILKSKVREITFGLAVITWNFFLIFYCCKIASFGPLKVRFEGEKPKDMSDEGIIKTLIHGRKEQRDSGFLKWLLVEFIVLDSRPVNLIVTAAKFSDYLSRVLCNKTYEANSC